jgi:uncharacterized protein YkwD
MKSFPLFVLIILLTSSIAFSQSGITVPSDLLAKAGPGHSYGSVSADVEPAPAIRALERSIFDRLNAKRALSGLAELPWSDRAAGVARLHSGNMAELGFFSHRGLDGLMVDERTERLGIHDWLAVGENIAFVRGYSDPGGIAVEKWMASPSHRNNLLGANWTEAAVGAAVAPDGTYYFTQVFFRRR